MEDNKLGDKIELGHEFLTTAQNVSSLSYNETKDILESRYIEKHKGEREYLIFKKNEEQLRNKSREFYEKLEKDYTPSEEYRNYIKDINKERKIKDAAALCQLTYVCDPNRSGDVMYHTMSKVWRPYLPENYDNIISKYAAGMFEVFKQDKKPDMKMDVEISLLDKFGFGRYRDDIYREFDKCFAKKRLGFFSMLYYHRKEDGKYHFVYVPAGTTFNLEHKYDLIKDISTDLSQAFTGFDKQYMQAVQNAKILNKICKEKTYDLSFYGHSLGGGMAISCALATDRPAIVFNNAGLSYLRNILHGTYWDASRNNIIRVYTDKDILSTEIKNKNLLMKPFTFLLSPQIGIAGESIYFGKGGHGIEGICRANHLSVIGNKDQIKDGI